MWNSWVPRQVSDLGRRRVVTPRSLGEFDADDVGSSPLSITRGSVWTTSGASGRPEGGGRPSVRAQGTMVTTHVSCPDAVVGRSRSSPLSIAGVEQKQSSLCSLSSPPFPPLFPPV